MSASLLGHQVALREPRLLALGAALAVLVVAAWLRRGRPRVPFAATLVRVAALAAFALALAQPSLARPAPVGATVFVVDLSRSMSMRGEGPEALARRLGEAVVAAERAGGTEPLGLVAFAERAAVIGAVGALPADPTEIATRLGRADVGSRDHTNLTGALRLAEALPTAGSKRLVLVSDGVETLGRAIEWGAGARARGVTIDALPITGRGAGDPRLVDLRVPESVWQGDDIEVEAVAASEVAGEATVRLLVDGRQSGEAAIEWQGGGNVADTRAARFLLKPLAPGRHTIRVEVAPRGLDVAGENNALEASTVVRDKPRVLVLEGQQFAGDRLRRALERAGSEVTVRELVTLTDRLSDLDRYDTIVLVDVPAGALSFERQKALQEFVRTLGRGLVVTGGTHSFGKGAYEGSTLEETLPVRVKPRTEGKRSAAALLLIIDTSYSMDYPKGGPTRMEMAKTAAIGAVRSLSPGDEIAIVAFSDSNNWVTRLRTINGPGDIGAITDQISRLRPDGVTQMYPALRDGIDELAKSDAGTRHIIFLSDGAPTSPFDDAEVGRRVRAANLTLSSIAIGDGADTVLMERLAKAGGGRYSFARTPQDIPRLTLEEAETLAGKYLALGAFRAVQVAPSPILRGLDPATLPALDGYGITETKPDAQMILASGKNEPVLAQWQYGLGRVVAWTSDLSQELAPNWKDADAFGPFWDHAVRWTLAASGSKHFRVRTAPDGRDLILTVDAYDEAGAPVNLAETRATLRTPDGATVPVVLPQSAPGRYETRLAAPAPGAYGLEIRQARPRGAVTDIAGFAVPYPAELRGKGGGGATLAALADRTGGQVVEGLGGLFSARERATAPRFVPIWPPVAALGLGLFLVDIALRLRHATAPAGRLRRLLPRR